MWPHVYVDDGDLIVAIPLTYRIWHRGAFTVWVQLDPREWKLGRRRGPYGFFTFTALGPVELGRVASFPDERR